MNITINCSMAIISFIKYNVFDNGVLYYLPQPNVMHELMT